MKNRCALVASIAGLALASAANAAVTFTFRDPGSPRELTYVQGGGGNPGTISYTSPTAVELVFNGAPEGLPVITYQTTLSMNLTVGVGNGFAGLFAAPVSGTFTFRDNASNQDVLTGTLLNGALLTFGTTGGIAGTSSNNTLVYTVGGPLATVLANANLSIVPKFDGAFSLSDIDPQPVALTQEGYIASFQASAAFVGNADVIPSAGSAALAGVAALFLVPGRKRRSA